MEKKRETTILGLRVWGTGAWALPLPSAGCGRRCCGCWVLDVERRIDLPGKVGSMFLLLRRPLVMRHVKIAFLGQQQAAAAACSSLQAERENDRNLMRDARESVEADFHSWTKHVAFRVWSDRQGLDCFTLVQPQSGCPMVAGMILL